ncbi:hypothetical protein M513_13906, partial [Trichuris suis]
MTFAFTVDCECSSQQFVLANQKLTSACTGSLAIHCNIPECLLGMKSALLLSQSFLDFVVTVEDVKFVTGVFVLIYSIDCNLRECIQQCLFNG